MALIKVRVGAQLDPSAVNIFKPLIAAAAQARQKIAAEGKAGAAEFVGGYRSAPAHAKKGFEAVSTAAEQSATKVAAAAKRAASEQAKAAEHVFQIKQRYLAAEEKAAAASLSKRQGQARAIAGGALSTMGGMLSRGAGVVGSIARGAGVDMDVGSLTKKVGVAQKTAVDITNAGYMEGEKGAAGQRQDPTKLLAEVRNVADAAALDTNEALAGLQKFVAKTSDLATGRDILADMAKLAKVTNASLDDMVDAAGDVSKNLGNIPDNAEKTKAIMTIIAAQGKLGSVEIKDLATQMAKVASGAGKFSGGTDNAIVALGAMAQTARGTGGAASANQAATSVASFVTDLTSKAGQKALSGKVDVWADKGKTTMKPVQEIVKDILKSSGGDLSKISAMVPGKQSGRAFTGFAKIFNDAEFKKKGSGIDAVDAEFKRLSKTLSKGEMMSSFGSTMETTESKVQLFNNAMERIAEDASGKLLPALEKLGPPALSIAKAFADLAVLAVDNPVKAAVGMIGAAFAKQIAAGALSQALTNATSSIGSFGLAAAAAAVALAAAYAITKKMGEEKDKGEEKAGNEVMDHGKVISKAAKEARKTGKLSPEMQAELARVYTEIEAEKAQGAAAKNDTLGESAGRFGEWVTGKKSLQEISGENEMRARTPQLEGQQDAIRAVLEKANMDPSKFAAALRGGGPLQVMITNLPGAPVGPPAAGTTTGPAAPR